MRTIKFRGKREFSSKWLVGSLLSVADEHFIYPEEAPHSYNTYRVNIDTVGQFTELYDKNAKEIYEGDVLKIYYHGKSKMFGVVRFAETRFFIDDEPQGEEPVKTKVPMAEMFSRYDFEVVGNIYDNPELLKNNDFKKK